MLAWWTGKVYTVISKTIGQDSNLSCKDFFCIGCRSFLRLKKGKWETQEHQWKSICTFPQNLNLVGIMSLNVIQCCIYVSCSVMLGEKEVYRIHSQNQSGSLDCHKYLWSWNLLYVYKVWQSLNFNNASVHVFVYMYAWSWLCSLFGPILTVVACRCSCTASTEKALVLCCPCTLEPLGVTYITLPLTTSCPCYHGCSPTLL